MELLNTTTREYTFSDWAEKYPIVPNDWKNMGAPYAAYEMTRREHQYNFMANCMRVVNIRSCDMKSCTLPEDLMSFSEEMFSHDNVYYAVPFGMITAKDKRNLIMQKLWAQNMEEIKEKMNYFFDKKADIYLSYMFAYERNADDTEMGHTSGIYLHWAACDPNRI